MGRALLPRRYFGGRRVLAGAARHLDRMFPQARIVGCSHLAAAIGFYGPHVRIGNGSAGGWDVFGPRRRVTRSVGNVLFELDGKPALDLYERYLGEGRERASRHRPALPVEVFVRTGPITWSCAPSCPSTGRLAP